MVAAFKQQENLITCGHQFWDEFDWSSWLTGSQHFRILVSSCRSYSEASMVLVEISVRLVGES